MMRFSSLLLSALLATAAAAASINKADISVHSNVGKSLMHQARRLDDGDDYAFVGDYSIKFQGCHHVQQWNEDADDEDDVRIKTKRLARFRLCPADQCSDNKSAGCTSKYGDYIVDMSTFVTSYLTGMETVKEELCEATNEDCEAMCGNDDADCIYDCYDGYDATFCLDEDQDGNDNGQQQLDALDYAACAEFDFGGNRRLEDANNDGGEVVYYLGPYCADQGGEIHLGLFSDDTCTTFIQDGETMFSSVMGYELPYSDDSLITTRCFDCATSDGDGNSAVSETCTDVYQLAGKCETKMTGNDYPNEASCGYIEGIKIIREDGVIRTSSTRKSKTAAVAIGLFMTLSVLLAGYVYYLRTKLGRAQINLSAASQPLT